MTDFFIPNAGQQVAIGMADYTMHQACSEMGCWPKTLFISTAFRSLFPITSAPPNTDLEIGGMRCVIDCGLTGTACYCRSQ